MTKTKLLSPPEKIIQQVILGGRFNHPGFSPLIRELFGSSTEAILASYVKPGKKTENNIRFTLTHRDTHRDNSSIMLLLTSLYDSNGRIESIIEESHGNDARTSFKLHKFEYDCKGRVTYIKTSFISSDPDPESYKPYKMGDTLKNVYKNGSIDESLIRLGYMQEFTYEKNEVNVNAYPTSKDTIMKESYPPIVNSKFKFNGNEITLLSKDRSLTIILNEKGNMDTLNLTDRTSSKKRELSGKFTYNPEKSLEICYDTKQKKVTWRGDFKTKESFLEDQPPRFWERDKGGGALKHYIGNHKDPSIILGSFGKYHPDFMDGQLPSIFRVELKGKSHQYALLKVDGRLLTLFRRENNPSYLNINALK
ncbi:hypothetical protein KY358_05435 [Candidatus Woesearchaeota archaeon]|nr:hypothetical protein [Candidatus Woesearchaeota archaeon]